MVKVTPSSSNCLLSGIYANPKLKFRKILWNNLKSIVDVHSFPWLVLGDFNDVLNQFENLGGGPINLNRVNYFNEGVQYCNLTNLGFFGPLFTWTNSRSSNNLWTLLSVT